MERLSLILLTTLLMTGLAGCVDDDAPKKEDDSPSDVQVETESGVKVAEDRGVVLGTVLSDTGSVIQDARVSLLGTEHFTDTNDRGNFTLKGIVPATYRLQVQAEGFKVALIDVEVHEGEETRVEVELQPDQVLITARPHVHNLWKGRTEVTLADLELDLTEDSGFRDGSQLTSPAGISLGSVLLEPNTDDEGVKIPVPDQEDGSPSIVYPGTGRIEVTLDWEVDGDTTKDELGLEVAGPNFERTRFDPQPPTATWSWDINQTQVDGGHELWTSWRFSMIYQGRVYDPTNWDPGLNLGSVHVVIKIFKGDEPALEPPHPDLWEGNSTKLLHSAEEAFSYGGYPTSDRETFEQSPDEIVPPGTAMLRVTMTWRFENVIVPLFGDEYNLMWRTAAQNPFTTTWDDYHIGEPVESGEGYKVYEIPVGPRESDQHYATRSDWSFSPYRPGEETSNSDYSAQNRDRVFTLEVVAFKA